MECGITRAKDGVVEGRDPTTRESVVVVKGEGDEVGDGGLLVVIIIIIIIVEGDVLSDEVVEVGGVMLVFEIVADGGGEVTFAQLALEDPDIDGSGDGELVDEDGFGLPKAEEAGDGLVIVGGIPARFKEDDPVRPEQVEAAASSSEGEGDKEDVRRRVVHSTLNRGPGIERRRPVEPGERVLSLGCECDRGVEDG